MVWIPPHLGSGAAAQRARVLRKHTKSPSINNNTKPLSFDIKPYSLYKFMCGLIQKSHVFIWWFDARMVWWFDKKDGLGS
jgi:hypothetical protein